MATKLSKNFTLEEFYTSATANARKINNMPDENIRKHIQELVDNILQPLRDAWGSGIHINSGYRCPKLNTAVGGSKTSAHLTGYAADTKPVNGKMAEYQAFVRKFLADKKYDQFIIEYPVKNVAKWIHIGYKNLQGKQRKQNLVIK